MDVWIAAVVGVVAASLHLIDVAQAIRRGMRELKPVRDDRSAVIALLAEARRDDAPADLKVAIILALGRHGGRESTEALAEVLHHDASWRARVAATVALGSLNSNHARELLKAATSDEDRRVRESAEHHRNTPGTYSGCR